tara:strand:- start:1966 stop:2301 length:336 start_codon:yes stop_codon:yes gene_type:complete
MWVATHKGETMTNYSLEYDVNHDISQFTDGEKMKIAYDQKGQLHEVQTYKVIYLITGTVEKEIELCACVADHNKNDLDSTDEVYYQMSEVEGEDYGELDLENVEVIYVEKQ